MHTFFWVILALVAYAVIRIGSNWKRIMAYRRRPASSKKSYGGRDFVFFD